MKWPMQKAKARFSQLIDQACTDGLQMILRDRETIAVVMSISQYQRMMIRRKSLKATARKSPKQLLASAPLEGVEITRSKDTGRLVKL